MKKSCFVLSALACFYSPVLVADASQVEITGFINAIASYAVEEKTLGYEADTANFAKDSALGIQINKALSPKFSAAGQLLAKGKNDFDAEATWAYIAYHMTPSTTLRMGRFRTPFFLYSDHLDVGYAQHWVMAPHEVYSVQLDSVDGVDLTKRFSWGPLDNSIQLYAGASRNTYALTNHDVEFDIELREQMGIVGTVNYGILSLRASFHQATEMNILNFQHLNIPAPFHSIGLLTDYVEQMGTDYPEHAQYLLNYLEGKNITAEFSEVALRLQGEHFFLVGEGTLMTFDQSILAKQRRHLVSAGTVWHHVTVYTTYARANDDPQALADGVPEVYPMAENLIQTFNLLTNVFALESESISVGIRYDFEPGVAFKFEVLENRMNRQEPTNLVRGGFQLTF